MRPVEVLDIDHRASDYLPRRIILHRIMSDIQEQIGRLLEQAGREGYARAANEAIAILEDAIARLRQLGAPPPSVQPRPRGRPAKAIGLVHDMVVAKPGLTGVEIVKALAEAGTPVMERTARSCLRRLRDSKVIWQRQKKWYPRPKESATGAESVKLGPPMTVSPQYAEPSS